MPPYVYALMAHGVIWALDVFINHEWHLFLFMNLGIMVTLTGQAMLGWHALPAGLAPVNHGWASWVLTAMALGALGWALRDGLAALRMGRKAAVV